MQTANRFFLAALLLAVITKATAAPEKRWNIVSIVTDDQARWSVGAYGNKEAITPNMDRLAREGALFTNAFVNTPVCSPSRTAFLAGVYGTRVGITDWLSAAENRDGKGLPSTAITWPQVLQQNGYQTGLVGKWHLGNQSQFHPTKHGYDYFYGIIGGGSKAINPRFEVDGETTTVQGATSNLVGDAAVQFIDSNATAPFALSIHFREPHLPYRPMPEEDIAPFRTADLTIPTVKGIDVEQVKDWTRNYYASIHAADRNIGRVLDKLDKLGLTSNTIVLFTSDHGYMIGQHGLHTKGNAHWIAGGVDGPKRPNMFDDSIRVPLLVRMPGAVAPGTRIETAVSNIDTFPTVLSLLGVKTERKTDGRDVSGLLRGEKLEETPVFGQYDLHNSGLAYMRMIRTTKWKLVRYYFCDGLDELYDLAKDPGENRNLYGKKETESVRADLQKQLVNWQRSIDDPILTRLSAKELSGEGAGVEE